MKAKIFSAAALCLLAVSAVLFTACEKENSDVTKPVIKLEEPENGDTLLTHTVSIWRWISRTT